MLRGPNYLKLPLEFMGVTYNGVKSISPTARVVSFHLHPYRPGKMPLDFLSTSLKGHARGTLKGPP